MFHILECSKQSLSFCTRIQCRITRIKCIFSFSMQIVKPFILYNFCCSSLFCQTHSTSQSRELEMLFKSYLTHCLTFRKVKAYTIPLNENTFSKMCEGDSSKSLYANNPHCQEILSCF